MIGVLPWPATKSLSATRKHTAGVHNGLKVSALYLVTENVDAVHQRFQEAGGDLVAGPHETEFGVGATAYPFTTRDTEGNLWTIGTYRGAE